MTVEPATSEAATAEPATAESGSERVPSQSWWSRLRARLPLRRPALALSLPVAAAAAVAIVLVTSSGSSPHELQFAMVVEGTPLAPGAHGSATLTKKTSGWEIKLNATGLPRREVQAVLRGVARRTPRGSWSPSGRSTTPETSPCGPACR